MRKVDVIVIGAGPAGMAAATHLAERGRDVVVVDDQRTPGGQIYRGAERNAASPARARILGADAARGAALIAAFRASGARYWPESRVWRVTAEREVSLTRNGRSETLGTPVVIAATGAMERPVPVPGWTLPGVMTAGALQTLLKGDGLVPAEPPVLVGSGPLLLLLANQLIAAGVAPAAIVETSVRPWAARGELSLVLEPVARRDLWRGLAMLAKLRRARVPHYRNATEIRIEGSRRAEAVSFVAGGRRQRIAASLFALHEGVIPAQQLSRSLGIAHDFDERHHAFGPRVDGRGESPIPGILFAGDCVRIAGAAAAEHAGRIAAISALRMLTADPALDAAALADEQRQLQAHARIQSLVDAVYPPPAMLAATPDETVICRCENVTAGELRAAVAAGCAGPNQAKSFLRVGMGPCQGRLCGPTVAGLIAEMQHRSVGDVGYFRIRAPLQPVTVGELADMQDA
ncbi:FAD/NAD(P)-dependent oxidoreductase [Acuticoccus mangrovi]|uniref:FAD-dependent oxidoreductase n=1 Tax=Acuticoccus mangrovi TaxID=2796142 RepID=A0A934INI3_9HYPH|nr:NAD(P)/FAD-dependent oxidoreductase [Acuticoccus mangrovi]MBJ3775643.1 FAD-dependent oxidoreductase [Acuticoccus mangrovi]